MHYKDIVQEEGFKTLTEGEAVEFTTIETEKGLQAKEVRVLPVQEKKELEEMKAELDKKL